MMATTIVTTLAPMFRAAALGVSAAGLRAGSAVIRTFGVLPSQEAWAPKPTYAAWVAAKQWWVSNPTSRWVHDLVALWRWETRVLLREGSVWAPMTMRHARDVRGPSLFASDLNEFALGSSVDLLLVALLLCAALVVALHMYPPGDLGFWDTTPCVLPGTYVTPTRGPNAAVEAWIIRACGGVTPVTSVFRRRLRRRARWVRVAEAILGTRYGTLGQLAKGKWVPDHISPTAPREVAWLLGSVEGGVRLLGGGVINGRPGKVTPSERCANCSGKVPDCACVRPAGSRTAPGEQCLYLVVDIRGEVSVVFPSLLAKLRLYALCRQRDVQLLGALRTRAVEWCKAQDLDEVSSDLAVTGALGLAMMPSTLERVTHAQVAQAMTAPPFPHALQ
jgi:hypothetical protein